MTEELSLWWRGESDQSLPKLLAWATAHRLLPLLAWRANQQGWSLPTPLARAAQQARYQNQAQQALALRQLEGLGQLAQRLDIPIVLVKGPVVAQGIPALGCVLTRTLTSWSRHRMLPLWRRRCARRIIR